MPARTIRAHLVCSQKTEEGKPCPGRREVDGWTELRNAEAVEQRRREQNGLGREDYDGGGRDLGQNRSERIEEQRALALQGWAAHQAGQPVTDEHRAAASAVGVRLEAPEYRIDLTPTEHYRRMRSNMIREERAQGTLIGSAGGYTVPEGFVANLERALLKFDSVRPHADVMRTANGAEMPWPTANDTGNKGEIIGENPASANEQDIDFGAVRFGAHLFSSKMVRISMSLIEDSAFNMATTLGDFLGERIGRRQNQSWTVGTGANDAEGFTVTAPVGKTAASATAITADELIDLEHSVDSAYRDGAMWQFNDTVLAILRKLKDSQGQYLWQPSLEFGAPDLFNGRPYETNNDMAGTVEANAITVAFGQFMKYKIRDVNTIRLRRLDERYGELDQVAFVAFMRADGHLLDAGTGPLKVLKQAAA